MIVDLNNYQASTGELIPDFWLPSPRRRKSSLPVKRATSSLPVPPAHPIASDLAENFPETNGKFAPAKWIFFED